MVGSGRTRNRNRNNDSLHIQRERANKRERERTKALNSAYLLLRRKIPSLPSDKTSKIHTLRVTIDYIQFLCEMDYNHNNILNKMDLILDEDGQINFAAMFNSWRTSKNQKWHMAILKQQQARKRHHHELNEQSQSAGPPPPPNFTGLQNKDIYCPNEFTMFTTSECLSKPDVSGRSSRKVKAEYNEFTYGADRFGYGSVDGNISFECTLGHVITQTQL